MQCCLEAALAWNGTHTAQAERASRPALRSAAPSAWAPPCLSSWSSPSHGKRRVSAGPRKSPSASAIHPVPPAPLPSCIISPLSWASHLLPWLLSGSWLHVQPHPSLCKPCLEPASSSGYSHPSPSLLCREGVVSPPRCLLAPELAVTLLLPARGWKRSHWSCQWPPRDRFAVISSPTFLEGKSLRLSPLPTRSVLGFHAKLPSPQASAFSYSHQGTRWVPVSGSGLPPSQRLFIHLTTGQLRTHTRLEILWAAPIYCALTISPLPSPNKPLSPPYFLI